MTQEKLFQKAVIGADKIKGVIGMEQYTCRQSPERENVVAASKLFLLTSAKGQRGCGKYVKSSDL